MECEITRDGRSHVEPTSAAPRRRAVKRKFGNCDVGVVQLGDAAALPGADAALQVHLHVVARHAPADRHHADRLPAVPFMSNMDEITYWIYTKRAPCLMNYDNLVKKQKEEAAFSKPKPQSIGDECPSPKKKKKRKLSLLDGSVSLDKQANIYFEASRENQRPMLASSKSDTIDSDIDFNIKNSSIQGKPKRMRLQKNSRTTLHKKNKVVTSTPKVTTALRRSLRRAQNSLNKNSQFDISFDAYTSTVVNGKTTRNYGKFEQRETVEKSKNSSEKLANGDHSEIKKDLTKSEKVNNHCQLNGQFEDLSDVSGFTANYIRSTKLHSTKTPRNLRSKGSRNLMKESRQNLKKDKAMLVFVNKSINTTATLPKSAILNCSTDSSQNVINLVTVRNNEKCTRVNKSTSLLKFMDTNTQKIQECVVNKVDDSSKQTNKTNPNVSFLSRSSSTSRYPKRYKNSLKNDVTAVDTLPNQLSQTSVDKRKRINKSTNEFNNSDRKENPEETTISRTRSGRSIGLKVRQPENSVLVVSNITEPMSSVTMNVAVPNGEDESRDNVKKKKLISCVKYVGRVRQSVDKSGQSLRRESLRDRSGFAACFSDSDDDSEPLKQKKFFC